MPPRFKNSSENVSKDTFGILLFLLFSRFGEDVLIAATQRNLCCWKCCLDKRAPRLKIDYFFRALVGKRQQRKCVLCVVKFFGVQLKVLIDRCWRKGASW